MAAIVLGVIMTVTWSNSTGDVDSVFASRHAVLHRPAVMIYHTCHRSTVLASITRVTIAAVLLELSCCAATITVEFPDSTRWQFTLSRLWGLIAIFAVVVLVMHLGFRLIRWYMPDRR